MLSGADRRRKGGPLLIHCGDDLARGDFVHALASGAKELAALRAGDVPAHQQEESFVSRRKPFMFRLLRAVTDSFKPALPWLV